MEYNKISAQEYILSGISVEHIETLFALRSKMLKVKANFPRGYATPDEMFCTHGCDIIDTIQQIPIEELMTNPFWQKLFTGMRRISQRFL